MMIEIVVTAAILLLAAYLLFRSLKKSASGKCNCGSCASSCPKKDRK